MYVHKESQSSTVFKPNPNITCYVERNSPPCIPTQNTKDNASSPGGEHVYLQESDKVTLIHT